MDRINHCYNIYLDKYTKYESVGNPGVVKSFYKTCPTGSGGSLPMLLSEMLLLEPRSEFPIPRNKYSIIQGLRCFILPLVADKLLELVVRHKASRLYAVNQIHYYTYHSGLFISIALDFICRFLIRVLRESLKTLNHMLSVGNVRFHQAAQSGRKHEICSLAVLTVI